jgi:HSP20 family molecular chaperone IbpA
MKTPTILLAALAAAMGWGCVTHAQVFPPARPNGSDEEMQEMLQRMLLMQQRMHARLAEALRDRDEDPFFATGPESPAGLDPFELLNAMEQSLRGGNGTFTAPGSGSHFSVTVTPSSPTGGAVWSFQSGPSPAVRTVETVENYEFRLKKPQQDHSFDIRVENGLLTIRLESRAGLSHSQNASGAKVFANSSKSFQRSFRLPDNAHGDRFITETDGDDFVVKVPKKTG